MNRAEVRSTAVANSAVGTTMPPGTAVDVGVPGRNCHLVGIRGSVPAILVSNSDPVAVAGSCTDHRVGGGTDGRNGPYPRTGDDRTRVLAVDADQPVVAVSPRCSNNCFVHGQAVGYSCSCCRRHVATWPLCLSGCFRCLSYPGLGLVYGRWGMALAPRVCPLVCHLLHRTSTPVGDRCLPEELLLMPDGRIHGSLWLSGLLLLPYPRR